MSLRTFRPAALLAILAIACGTPTVPPDAMPQAELAADVLAGEAPLTVNFTGLAVGGDEPLRYKWDFGDRGASEETSPAHTYEAAGLYTVVFTVTDADGDMDQDETVVSVTAPALDVRVDASPLSGQAPLQVSFTASARGGTPPYYYDWDFADGSRSTLQNPVHSYASGGTYEARVTVSDAERHTVFGQVRVSVAGDSAPEAVVSASPTAGSAPLNVTFQGSVVGGDAPITFNWDFGDGSKDDVQSPSHTYKAPGTYQAVLTVTDVDGDTDTAQVSVQVVADAVPQVRALADKTQGMEPLTVGFSSQVTSGDPPYTYAWDFGDGGSAAGDRASHAYTAAGKYTATLTVTDADGDAVSDSVTINVSSNSLPAVSATASPGSGAAPLSVAFDASVSGGDAPITFAWAFGDGGTATLEDPTHVYAAEGTYTARVTATDANGDQADATVQIVVQQSLPDLAASNLRIEPQADQVIFRFTVSNLGNSPTGDFYVDFYIDRATAPGPGLAGDGWILENGLAAGEVRDVAAFLPAPQGQYQGWLQLDTDDNVAEADETNNVAGPDAYTVEGPLVLNELLYDPPSADTGCFVELAGPAGTDLTGYQLVGVNGANGSDYATVDLSGTVRSDGFFVVAQDGNVASTQVDQTDPAVDFQNGPDAVQLRFHGAVVDAVGYGTGAATFAGEGTPAPDPASSDPQSKVSIGRSYNSVDTDDNGADFSVLDYPSPGGRNPVSGDTCGYAITVSGPASLSGSTAGAGDEYHAAACGDGTSEPDVVYAIPLQSGQRLEAEILQAADGFDTVLYLRGTCTSQASERACDDDGGVAPLSHLTYTATATGTYYLVVDGYSSATDDWGTYDLLIDIR